MKVFKTDETFCVIWVYPLCIVRHSYRETRTILYYWFAIRFWKLTHWDRLMEWFHSLY